MLQNQNSVYVYISHEITYKHHITSEGPHCRRHNNNNEGTETLWEASQQLLSHLHFTWIQDDTGCIIKNTNELLWLYPKETE